MKNRLLRLVALSATLAPSLAGAIGFGDILLHSRIGEPLLAEVALTANNETPPDAACFSLKPPSSGEFPGIAAGTIRLVNQGGSARLLITSSSPVFEPIVVLGIKVGCKLNLEHQYLLMPQAPLVPFDRGSESALPDKEAMPIPNRELQASNKRQTKEWPQKSGAHEEAKPKLASKPASTGDRLLLSLPSEATGLTDKRTPQPTRLSAMRARVEKLEHSLTQLNRELDSMHAIISETVELLDAPVKLQMSQNLELQQAAPSRPQAASPSISSAQPMPPEDSRWHELLVSALLGGGIAISVAHLLARRREGISPG